MISSFESGVCVFLPKASRVLTVGEGRTRDGVAWTKPRDEFGVTWEWLKAPHDAERKRWRVSERVNAFTAALRDRENVKRNTHCLQRFHPHLPVHTGHYRQTDTRYNRVYCTIITIHLATLCTSISTCIRFETGKIYMSKCLLMFPHIWRSFSSALMSSIKLFKV